MLCFRWQYKCLDAEEIIEAIDTTDSGWMLEAVYLFREEYATFWIDEVVVAGVATTEHEES